MKNLLNVKEIAKAGLVASTMFVVSLFTFWLTNFLGKTVIQFSDIIYLALFSIVKAPTLIVSACIGGMLTDILTGGFIFIPITILVKILIGITYYFLSKSINKYLAVFISYFWIVIYVLYAYILFDEATMILESIIDSIQYLVTTIFACIFIKILDLKNKIKFEE